jgi:hypothetical protein
VRMFSSQLFLLCAPIWQHTREWVIMSDNDGNTNGYIAPAVALFSPFSGRGLWSVLESLYRAAYSWWSRSHPFLLPLPPPYREGLWFQENLFEQRLRLSNNASRLQSIRVDRQTSSLCLKSLSE